MNSTKSTAHHPLISYSLVIFSYGWIYITTGVMLLSVIIGIHWGASSLTQLAVGGHATPLGHIILIPCQQSLLLFISTACETEKQ